MVDEHETVVTINGRFVGRTWRQGITPSWWVCRYREDAFILDQVTQPDVIPAGNTDAWAKLHAAHWRDFAKACDAKAVMLTPETIEIVEHPTPEEYARGYKTEHECDGCLCSPDTVLAVVTRLKGSVPSPDEIKAFLDQHEANRAAEKRLLDAIFHDEDAPTAEEISARVAEGIRERGGLGVALNFPSDEELRAAIAKAPISGDWTPEVTQPARGCGAMSGNGAGCVREFGHPYLHEFAMPAAPLDSGDDTAGA